MPTGDGRVVVKALTANEALALDGLLAPRRPLLPGTDLSVPLSRFEAALSAARIRSPQARLAVRSPRATARRTDRASTRMRSATSTAVRTAAGSRKIPA